VPARLRPAAAALGLGLSAIFVTAALPASARGISPANLKALTNSINRAKSLTYVATYASVNGGLSTVVTIAQSPPKSNFSTSAGSVINDGQKTYYCATGGKQQCLSVSGANPLLGLEDLFSPQLALSAFAEAKRGLMSRLLAIMVSSSSATYAGQPSTCVTVTVRGEGGKYCVTRQGILSYSGSSPTSYVELTRFSSSPPSSLFTPPSGAATFTLPSGVTVPSIPSVP
jgi:hypothetical protein